MGFSPQRDIPEPPLDEREYRGEPNYPHCPKCGAEAEDFYADIKTHEMRGCDHCLRTVKYWDWSGEEYV